MSKIKREIQQEAKFKQNGRNYLYYRLLGDDYRNNFGILLTIRYPYFHCNLCEIC